MPPGPAFNWFCVAHSLIDVLSNAAAIRAGQVYPRNAVLVSKKRRQPDQDVDYRPEEVKTTTYEPTQSTSKEIPPIYASDSFYVAPKPKPPPPVTAPPVIVKPAPIPEPSRAETLPAAPLNAPADTVLESPPQIQEIRKLTSSKVPSSRIGRFFHYGGLAATLSYGAASEMLRRSTSNDQQQGGSLMLTEANVNRLVTKLSRMRGAALKLGQFMSIQGMHL